MKIRVVGAGWYGCHLAEELGCTVFERDGVFSGASGNNQSRLHLGFHYPRDSRTRVESRAGYDEFLLRYPKFSQAVHTNIYGISHDSLVDWGTYKEVMRDYLEVDPSDYGLRNLEGAMLTKERLILPDLAKEYFESRLDIVHEEVTELSSKDWDVTIDCTYGAFVAPSVEWYEPCVLFLYKGPQIGITVMDGPAGVSLYPHPRGVSLTSVKETPLGRRQSMAEALRLIDRFREADAWRYDVREDMESRIRKYIDFENYEYLDCMTSVRVKPKSSSDRRVNVITPWADVISVFPGKISTVFEAAREVKKLLC